MEMHSVQMWFRTLKEKNGYYGHVLLIILQYYMAYASQSTIDQADGWVAENRFYWECHMDQYLWVALNMQLSILAILHVFGQKFLSRDHWLSINLTNHLNNLGMTQGHGFNHIYSR